MSNIWISTKEQEAIRKWEKRREREFGDAIWNNEAHKLRMKRRQAKASDPLYNAKYAWIRIGNTRHMAMLTQDMKTAYKLESKRPVATSMKWSRFTFERWCTSFDL